MLVASDICIRRSLPHLVALDFPQGRHRGELSAGSEGALACAWFRLHPGDGATVGAC